MAPAQIYGGQLRELRMMAGVFPSRAREMLVPQRPAGTCSWARQTESSGEQSGSTMSNPETPTVWRPIVFVDVHVGGRDLPEVAGRQVNESEALFEKGVFYFAGLGSFRYQWAGRACGVFGRKQGDGLAIGRPARRGQEALGAGQLLGRATRSAHHIQLELAGFHGIGEERHLPAVR